MYYIPIIYLTLVNSDRNLSANTQLLISIIPKELHLQVHVYVAHILSLWLVVKYVVKFSFSFLFSPCSFCFMNKSLFYCWKYYLKFFTGSLERCNLVWFCTEDTKSRFSALNELHRRNKPRWFGDTLDINAFEITGLLLACVRVLLPTDWLELIKFEESQTFDSIRKGDQE